MFGCGGVTQLLHAIRPGMGIIHNYRSPLRRQVSLLFDGANGRCRMSTVTRRQVIRAGVAAGAALSAGTANAGPEKEEPSSFVDRFLPTQLTKEGIQASKGV